MTATVNLDMVRRHSREEILDGALAVAFESGLSQLSFGRVAKRLGIADRTVVYYFPTKDDLHGEVVMAMGGRLRDELGKAFDGVAGDHLALVRRAWPVLADEAVDPTFALFFEAIGLAAAGREPFRTLVPALVEAWVVWVAEFVAAPDDATRRAEAEAVVALVDGLLLVRQLAGPDAADRAAARLGVT